ncbi:MAG: FlgD immunoglobulin-like domain containing protein [Candidatus Krumholzibacteriia bacterium]
MRRVIVLILLALLAAAVPAEATVSRNPIKFRLERPERLPTAGREFTVTLVVEAGRAVEVSGLQLSGSGWGAIRVDGPDAFALEAGESRRLAVQAVPREGFGKLAVTAEVEGRTVKKAFDLSREAYGGILPSDSDLLPPRRLLPAGGEKFKTEPSLTLAEMTGMAVDESAPSDAGDKAYPCTVTGNLCYWHGTQNRWLPASFATVWVWVYPPTGFYYSVGTQKLDETGVFSIQIPDGVTIALAFAASSNAVVVQEDNFAEDNYVWTTARVDIPVGMTHYDAGPIYPSHHHGALHIVADVTYAHNQYRDLGMDLTKIDAQWPDDDGSFYNDYFEELHYDRGDEWHDGTICHEYGHYWHHQYAHEVTHDYCNGICDDGDDCGHCLWCPEEDEVAWIEGCAQILSRLSTDYIEDRALWKVVHYDMESVNDDPNCPWDPWYIENVVAGAAWDVIDNDRGTETDAFGIDALGTVLYDQLDLDTIDILRIMTDSCAVEGHQPYRWPGLFRCAAEYIDDLGRPDATRAMLWETLKNWDLDIDDQSPGAPQNLTTSFPINTPTTIALGGFYWEPAPDDMSGAGGYSVSLTQNAPVLPDHVVDTTKLWWWPDDPLAPGTWYFTVVAVDRTGKWSGDFASYGPIIIAPQGPADLEPYTYSGWTAPVVLRSTLAPVAPDPVVQTNFIQGNSVYFNWGAINTGTGSSGVFKDVFYVDGVPAYTSNGHSLNIGNSSSWRNQGPVDLGVIGRHTVWVALDGEGVVAESDEGDNMYAKQFVFSVPDLDLEETIVRSGGLPDAYAGAAHLWGGGTFHPNCDGFDVELCLFPEVVWAVPQDPNDAVVLRLHTGQTDQTGFGEDLVSSASLPNRAAVVIQNPAETMMTDYAVSVMDQEDAGAAYTIHRELGLMFALPDTLPGVLDANDCLDFYYTYNDLGRNAWFSVKVANGGGSSLRMRFYDPDFAMGTLADADLTLTCAAEDTVVHSLLLEPGKLALTVVDRDPRLSGTNNYSIFAYEAKPDLVASTPAGWFANVVPQVGLPYAVTDPIPAPNRLAGNADSTGFYWSLLNDSPDAGIPIGLQRRVELDGAFLFGSMFIDPLAPGYEVKIAQSGLRNVRGGRHTVVHKINPSRGIDEDDYANNHHGRQWVWEPGVLVTGTVHTLALPAEAYNGLTYLTEGSAAPNCDGYRFNTTLTIRQEALLVAYGGASAADVDLGLYGSADVQDGFTEPSALSGWSGSEGDFVLRYMQGPGSFASNLGVTRGYGLGVGSVTLGARTAISWWNSAPGTYRDGVIEAGTFVDDFILPLQPGLYRFRLISPDAPLGFSLHDVSDGYSSKSEYVPGAIAWQLDGALGEPVDFVVRIPDPAPARLALVIWRREASTHPTAASWNVSIGNDVTGVDDGDGTVPRIAASRLVGAAPNPFNPRTEIAFETATAGNCALTIHDLRGRLVRRLVTGEMSAGRHTVVWDGLDEAGQRTPSGLYVARMVTGSGETSLLKLTLVK